MALREVLTNYTFEQQRQVINNIGEDIGDLELLNTAQTDIVSAINAINQTVNPTSGLFLNGTVNPENTVGLNGDFYLNVITEELFGPKANNVWPTEPVNFKGLLYGETNPSVGDGVIGSFYIKTTTQDLFGPKTESGWEVSAISLSKQLLSGIEPPESSDGKIDDYYLDTQTRDLYGPKTVSGWGTPISLSEQVLSGSAAPLSTSGKNGDFYLDTLNRNLYGPKTTGNWNVPIPLGEEEIGTVIFVNATGNDTRNGLSIRNAVKTLKRACEIARSTDGNVTIKMFSGEYFEDNPIYVPKGTSIVGDNLRETIIRPLNDGEDFLWITSGSYINYLVFRDNYGNASNPSDSSRGVGTLNTGSEREISSTELTVNLFPGHTIKRVDGIFKDGSNILTFRRQEIIDYAFNEMILEYPGLVIPAGQEQGGEATCKRDIGYFVDGLIDDLNYGGNMYSIRVGQSYFDAIGNLDHINGEFEETIFAFTKASFAAKAYVQDAGAVNSDPDFTDEYGIIIDGDCSNVVTNIDNLTSIVLSILDGEDAPRSNPGPGYVLINQEWMEVDDLVGNVLTIKQRAINNPVTNEQTLASRHISGSVVSQGARTWRYAVAYPDQDGITCKGRVSLSTSTTTVLGTNTKFLSECFVGGFIRFPDYDTNSQNDVTYKISLVVSDTQLVLVTPPSAALTNRKFKFIPPKERIFLSPYTQNCSAISVLGDSFSEVINGVETYDAKKTRAGGILVDGDQLEPNTPIKSMVCDAFTQVVSGGIGFHLKNDAYAQLVSVFEVFEDVGVLCETGAYTSITNSATNFGRQGLKAIGFSKEPYPFFIGNVSEIANKTKSNFNSNPSNIIRTSFEEENTKVRLLLQVSSADISKFEPNQTLDIALHVLPNPGSNATITALQTYINNTVLEVNRIVLSDNIVEILLNINWDAVFETLEGSQTGEITVIGGATFTEIEITGFDAKALPNYVIKFPNISLPPHPSGVEYIVDIIDRYDAGIGITVLTTQPKIPDSDLILITSNQSIQLRAPSTVNSSGHTFEYVGAGINYTALPQNGGRAIADFQSVESGSGKSYVSATDQDGNFFVGPFFRVDLRTGKATFSGAVALGVLDEIQLKSSPGVPIYEFSTDDNLGGGTGSKNTALPTQKAVRDYINKSTVLGNLVGLNKTTVPSPNNLVQLNASGKINSELLPPANPVNVFTVANEEERLALTTAVAGDVAYQTDTNVAHILLDLPATNPNNWQVFTGTNINASNIVSGIISPSRLGSGIANDAVFLSGGSKYVPTTQGLIPSISSPVLIDGNRDNVLKTGITKGVSSAVWNNFAVVITTSTNHGLTDNDWVEIEQIFPYGYNGFYQIDVTSPNTFTYSLAANPGEYVDSGFVTSGVKYESGFTELDIRRASFFSGQISGSSSVGVVKYDYPTFEINASSELSLREKGVTLGKLENVKRRSLLGNNEFPTLTQTEGNILELGLGEDIEQVTVFNVTLLDGDYRFLDRILDKDLGKYPTLHLVPGKSYKINLSVSGEPFFITTKSRDIVQPLETEPQSNYTDGVRLVNSRESGTIYFTVPFDAPNILYYQSGNSADKFGIIVIGPYEDPSIKFITAFAPFAIDSFNKLQTNTCKYLIQVHQEDGVNDRYHSTEIMLMHDGTDVFLTEYATLINDIFLGTFSAEINNNEVRLLFTANNLLTTTNLTVRVIKTSIF